MKIDKLSEEFKQKIKEKLDSAKPEEKSQAIYEAAVMIAEELNKGLIEEIIAQSARAEADEDYRKKLGLRVLSEEETKYYESMKEDVKMAITAKQLDIMPTSIIDRTLEDIRKESDILSLIRMAPADVKKWIVGSHSGSAVWGALTDVIKGELSANIDSLTIEQNKLTVYLVIPKAIRDLALPFVDKYFTAVLKEAMQDGMIKGYLDGDGKAAPIGIMRQIDATNTDGTKKAKTVRTDVTKFSPKGLKEVRKTLTNGGKRVVTELHLICNPLDEAEYVDPSLYGEALVGGYKNTSFMPIIKHPDPNCPEGKGIFTIRDAYTMGCTNVKIDEYDQTKAFEDADLVIGKLYANGRADDNNCAVVFDITKLEEYVLPVTQVTQATS